MKSIPENSVSAEDIREMMLTPMEKHLTLKTEGYRSSTKQTFNLLLKAVAEGSSLEAVCADSSGVVDSKTLREQLNAALPVGTLREQEAAMNAALAAAIPVGMPCGGLEIAIDKHDEPFYGKTPELRAYTCKTRAKAGTTHFFRIASDYVIWREVRLTLALTYVLPEDTLPQVVAKLLTRLAQIGLHATVLYLDKGFCSGSVMGYLQQVGQAAILACPIRGKQGGIRGYVRGDAVVSSPTTLSPTAHQHVWSWSIRVCATRKASTGTANGWLLSPSTWTGRPVRSTPNTAAVLALSPPTGSCVRSRC